MIAPTELINELSEAALSLDLGLINDLLQQVQELNPIAARAMSELLKRYEFEEALALLQVRKDD
jgi:hypothetical protein